MYVKWLIHVRVATCSCKSCPICTVGAKKTSAHRCHMTHLYVRHDSFMYVTWLIYMCVMTHSCMWRDSFMYVAFIYTTQLINIKAASHVAEADMRRICTGAAQHSTSYPPHDSCMHVTWLIHRCHMTHSYKNSLRYSRGAYVPELRNTARLIHDMTHSYTLHDPFKYAKSLTYTKAALCEAEVDM